MFNLTTTTVQFKVASGEGTFKRTATCGHSFFKNAVLIDSREAGLEAGGAQRRGGSDAERARASVLHDGLELDGVCVASRSSGIRTR